MNKIAILPTLLTLGNGVCGFAAIALASKITPEDFTGGVPQASVYLLLSAGLILGAMVFDALDGYAARRTKTASNFGGQLDSLCDAISFGAAPAFLLLRLGQDWDRDLVRRVIAVIAALYVMCTVLRLARFNVENSPDPASHKRFKGLPSPAAAGCVATLAILRAELPITWSGLDIAFVQGFLKVFTPLGGLAVALLMVSNFSYAHFNRLLLRRRSFTFVVQVVLVVCIIVLVRELALFLVFWGYAFNAPIRYLMTHGLHQTPNAPIH